MMDFDLLDTQAGRDIYEMGALDSARANVIVVLEVRFEIVPADIIEKVNKIKRKKLLRALQRKAIRCKDWDGFNETLSKALKESRF